MVSYRKKEGMQTREQDVHVETEEESSQVRGARPNIYIYIYIESNQANMILRQWSKKKKRLVVHTG